MPRNSSGTYTLPESPFVPATPISSSATNSNNGDIADALTDSLSRTGDGGMQAALGLHIDGFNYVADTDTGMKRTAANTQVIYCGATDVITLTPTTVDILGTRIFALPVGMGPVPWSGATAPAGWVLAGATYSRATYAALWAFAQTQIGLGNTFYGPGNGSTTFTVGTMEGYAVVGVDPGGVRLPGVTHVGDAQGNATVTLAANQIPTLVSSAANAISVSTALGVKLPGLDSSNSWNGTLDQTSGAGAFFARAGTSGNVTNVTTMSNASNNISVAYTNVSQQTTSIVQPSRAFNFIIYAGV